MHISLSRVEAWLLCKHGSGRSRVLALCTMVHSKTAAIPVVNGRSTRVAKIYHISGGYMVCIQAWFALKPDAESGLCAYKPGFYPRLYGNGTVNELRKPRTSYPSPAPELGTLVTHCPPVRVNCETKLHPGKPLLNETSCTRTSTTVYGGSYLFSNPGNERAFGSCTTCTCFNVGMFYRMIV